MALSGRFAPVWVAVGALVLVSAHGAYPAPGGSAGRPSADRQCASLAVVGVSCHAVQPVADGRTGPSPIPGDGCFTLPTDPASGSRCPTGILRDPQNRIWPSDEAQAGSRVIVSTGQGTPGGRAGLTAYDLRSRRLIWRSRFGQGSPNGDLSEIGRVVTDTRHRSVYAVGCFVRKMGSGRSETWSTRAGVAAYRLSDGHELWQQAVATNTLLFGTCAYDAALLPGGNGVVIAGKRFSRDPQGIADRALSAAYSLRGRLLWSQLGLPGEWNLASSSKHGDVVLLSGSGTRRPAWTTEAVNPRNGSIRWLQSLVQPGAGDDFPTHQAVSADGRQLFVTGWFDTSPNVVAYDVRTGERVWLAAPRPPPTVIGGQGVVVPFSLSVLDRSGQIVVASALTRSTAVAQLPSSVFVAALSTSTGRQQWTTVLAAPPPFGEMPVAVASSANAQRVFVTGLLTSVGGFVYSPESKFLFTGNGASVYTAAIDNAQEPGQLLWQGRYTTGAASDDVGERVIALGGNKGIVVLDCDVTARGDVTYQLLHYAQ